MTGRLKMSIRADHQRMAPIDSFEATGHIKAMPRPSSRDHLITSALETLHRQGFNGTSVQDITAAAGLPKGSFYNYFESKEALALEVVDRYGKEQAALAAVLSDESIRPVERLRRYFASLATNLAEQNYEGGCLIGNFSTELADQSRLIRDRLSANFAAWSRQIETCIRDGQKAGEISRDIDPRMLAAFLLNSFEGAILRMKVEKDSSSLDHFMTLIFSRVLT
jgi:TetR/AcrR family transcriptional regulator, transcriptional repressor for nem operon